MPRAETKLLVFAIAGIVAVMPVARAQSDEPGALPASSGGVSVPKNTTPPQPAAAQPALPSAAQASPPKPGSPVVEEIVEQKRPSLDVRKRAATRRVAKRRHVAHHLRFALGVDRPALAGVELVAPLPLPTEPPHYTVPVPAFPLDSVAAFYLTPPPPIVCHPTRRDRNAPDPRLYKEVPVECEPDNP